MSRRATTTPPDLSLLGGAHALVCVLPMELQGGLVMDEQRHMRCSECGNLHVWLVTIRTRAWFVPNREDDGRVPICDPCWDGRER